MSNINVYLSSFFAGGSAGLICDITLFPLDTLRTRFQAPKAFLKTGGFRGLYHGLGPQIVGNVPTAALFFCTYESFKTFSTPLVSEKYLPMIHLSAASVGAVVSCLARVPAEVVKQRRQTSQNISSIKILVNAYQSEGIRKGLYRGFASTVSREIPFSFIQFPIFEYLKVECSKIFENNQHITPSYQVLICGAIASGIAAAATTPSDVIKTNIMLAERKISIKEACQIVYRNRGLQGLFAGFIPRVIWITLGGAIYLWAYEVSKKFADERIFV